MNRLHYQALVLLVGLLSAIVSYFKVGSVEATVLLNFGLITGLLGAILIVFDLYFWRIGLFYPWFVPIPYLAGSWKVEGRIFAPGSTEVDVDEGKVTIEQKYSDLYMRIAWKDSTEMEFVEAAPIAVSGTRTKRCALSSIYKSKDPKGRHQTRCAFMSFDVAGTFFSNRPKKVTVFYSTTDGHHGELSLSR